MGLLNHGNVMHEGFYIFQYEATSPDLLILVISMVYRATAQWYRTLYQPDDVNLYVALGFWSRIRIWPCGTAK